MNGGRRNDDKDNKEAEEEGGWASTFLKLAGAAAATAAVVGGIYSVLNQPQAEVTPYGRRQPQGEVAPHGVRQPDHDEEEVILKVDGSLQGVKAGCGGYLRSASKKWICGFAQKLDPTTVSDTERQAILKGLIWVRGKGKRKVVVLSDNQGVVSSVGGAKDDYVRRQIRELLGSTDWEVSLSWITNDQNKVADKLADIARELPYSSLCEFDSVPPECAHLL